MKNHINKVLEFQKAFNQPVSETPVLVNPGLATLRFDLMKEENEEYLDAVADKNLVEIADALGDQLYILCGTILTHGMQYIISEVFTEIHNSNMSKLDQNGKPVINGENGIYDNTRPIGKVLKPKGYHSPNIKPILDKY